MVELLTETLEPALVAVYLYGSAVRGGLRADSDLDLLAVTDRPTTDDARRALIHGLMARSRSRAHRDRRHLEVSIAVAPDLRPWRYPPPLDFQYGDWWRPAYEAGDLRPWTSPSPDLAVLLTTARDDGVALLGPPAVEMLPDVPRADLDRAMRDVIPELLPGIEEDDTRNSLLTLARIWTTLATGRIVPKDEAAAWVLERLPAGAGEALRVARAAYRGEASDPWDGAARAQARRDWQAMLAGIETMTP